jgi:hypothetical protein
VLVYTRLSPWHSCQQEKITHGKTIALHSAAITVHKINAHNGSRMSARMQKPLNAAYHLKKSQRNKRHVVIGHTRHVDYLITSTSTPLCTMLATRAHPWLQRRVSLHPGMQHVLRAYPTDSETCKLQSTAVQATDTSPSA